MNIVRHGDTLRCGRYTFSVQIEPDDHGGPPWEDCEGHGVIRETRNQQTKYPGERPFGTHWLYDIPASIRKAKKEQWGLGPDAMRALTNKLKRTPTAKEITAQAVETNFAYCKGWTDGEWQYTWYRVALLDENGDSTDFEGSCGGFEVWNDDSENEYFYGEILASAKGLAQMEEVKLFPELRQREPLVVVVE